MEVELRDISKRYGRVLANDGINLSLGAGRIYGLLGENGAGKSTLMRILAGHTAPDSGRVVFGGRAVRNLTPRRAMSIGVGMLYQDPLDFPALTIRENFQLAGPAGGRRAAEKRLRDAAAEFGFDFEPGARVESLTVGERQQLEMLRQLEAGASLLILDEPTTGITLKQKDKLFETLRSLRNDYGRTVVFVTHKLTEAMDLCDRIFVMRQGRLAEEFDPPYDEKRLVRVMFGPDAGPDSGGGLPSPAADLMVRLEGGRFVGDKFALDDVNLEVRAGEIIGLAGLEGNGQGLLLRGLGGLARMTEGRLKVDGIDLAGRPQRFFRQAGIGFLPAARLEQGLFPDLSLLEHLVLAFPEQRRRPEQFFEERCVGDFNLRAHPDTAAGKLSGGNQQRLLLSLIKPDARLLLMEHPTRGLDYHSAGAVWEHLRRLCSRGASVIFSSADLDEVMAHSHRVLVFYNRRLAAELPASMASLDDVGGMMSGKSAG